MTTPNPPAFPAQVVDGGCDGIGKKDGVWHYPGMTLLDYFAAKAMQGMIAAHENGDDEHVAATLSEGLSYSGGWRGRIAAASYEMASAMLLERQSWIK